MDTEQKDRGINFKRQIWIEKGIGKFREILRSRKFKEIKLENAWMELKEGIKAAT